ncbi:MAG: hypothetical protein FWG99_02510 [Treponema sp.]|nr:hypothetical protein [Treponema sp.]
MKKYFFHILLLSTGALNLYAQADAARLAPGAESQLELLLNRPTMVKPALATPLGRNWFTLETDIHAFTDQVSLSQVRTVLLDIDNQDKYYSGKRSKINTTIISRTAGETIADFVSITIIPLGIQIKTPYRAAVRPTENTDSRFVIEIRQLSADSETNRDIKNLFSTRLVEEVTINGVKYVYIRMRIIQDVNASILPGARRTLENNAGPMNEEAIQMIIAAALTK